MAEEVLNWAEDLPDLCALVVFSHLDVSSLCQVAKTCHHWNSVSSTDDAWRVHCIENELYARTEERQTALKDLYRDWHLQFHEVSNFKYHHKRMKQLYHRLISWLEKNSPKILQSLNPGCQIADIQRVETMTQEFTSDLRVWLMLLNGQKRNLAGKKFGLFGGAHFYDYAMNMRLLPVDEISDLHAMINSSKSRVPDWLTNCVPVAQSFNAASFWFMLKNDTTFPEHPNVVFKRGSIITPSRNMRSCFPIAESFTALMQHHVEMLETGTYPVVSGEIQRFAAKGIPEAVTNHVRIRASPLFVPDQSVPGQAFTWAYRISMDMAEDAPRSAESQLTTRTWVITDGTGHVDNVHGPGVIGFFPKMSPGESFVYESCCPLSTPTGRMEGSFQMKLKSTGEEFDAIVPQFKFQVPASLKEK